MRVLIKFKIRKLSTFSTYHLGNIEKMSNVFLRAHGVKKYSQK